MIVLFRKEYEEEVRSIINTLGKKYNMRNEMGSNWFLGIRLEYQREERKIYLVHNAYLEKIATRFNLREFRTFPTTPLPTISLAINPGQASKAEVKLYQEKISSLVYTAIMIRPEVAYADAALLKFLLKPSDAYYQRAANQAIMYLYHTRYLALCFDGLYKEGQILIIASDASIADDIATRRSTQGYMILLFGAPILWKSGRQRTVTTSTIEAELLVLSEIVKETYAMQRLLSDIQLDLGVSREILCDNTRTIRLVEHENERLNTRLRHVDLQNM